MQQSSVLSLWINEDSPNTCSSFDSTQLTEFAWNSSVNSSGVSNETASAVNGEPPVLLASNAAVFILLLLSAAIEFFHYIYRQIAPCDKKEKIDLNLHNSLKIQIQLICHLLLSVVFPIAWIFVYFFRGHASGSFIQHLIRNVLHLLSWSFASALHFKAWDILESKSSIVRRGSVVLLVGIVCGFDRCLWWAKNDATNNCHLILFAVEVLTLLVTISLLLDEKAIEWCTLTNQEADDETSKKPRRSYRTKLTLILPYLWPKTDKKLQLRVVGCFIIIFIDRVINIFLPLNNKKIVDSLTYPNASTNQIDFRWDLIVIYAVVDFISDNVLSPMRNVLWTGVEQFTERETQVKLYEHLLSLSLRFHIGRKTGEVLQVMDRGTGVIDDLISCVLFSFLPIIADVVISILFFVSTYDYRFISIAFVTIILYTMVTIASRQREKQREEIISADDDFSAIGVDSLLNFETVKYYSAEDYETQRYRAAIEKSQKASQKDMKAYYFFDMLENFTTGGGLLAGSLLCAYLVSCGENGLSVGDYVLFATYMSKLTSPFCQLQWMHSHIKGCLVNMDKMFDIMEEKPEVADHPDAVDFNCTAGKIEFKNVSFGFTKDQPILKNISFVVQPGKTLAFVGPSGVGKSTVIRLLFRFYDVDSGQILFDDQDVTKVKQKSLRRHMGVVPQDTVLFNDTISYNIRYGRLEASDDEIIEAAKAADIHKSIEGFTDGYKTQVGERGLKLSGGEKQRVAIARTILKSPTFVFLDEATSALDTHTERNIQESLERACSGKTTVVIAHRLSTIIGADEIIVLQNGGVAETGRHSDLLDMKGIYYGMWMQQLSPEKLVRTQSESTENK